MPDADAARARFLPWLSRLSPVFIFTIDDGGQSLRLAARNDSAALLTDREAASADGESLSSPAMDPQVSGLLRACLRTRACARRDVVWRAISTGEERLMGLTAEFADPDAVILSVEDRGADGSSRRKLAVMHALAELAACATRSVLVAQAVRLLRGYLGSEAADFRQGGSVPPAGARNGAYEVPVTAGDATLGILAIPRKGGNADPDEPDRAFLETFAVLLGESLARLDRERAHRDLEASFRLLADSSEAAIVMLDTEGTILRWNAAAERMYGYPAHEIIGRNCALLYSAEDVAHAKPEEDLRLARRRGSIQSEETTRRRKDGGLFVVSVKTTALLDEDGKLRGYSRVARDVTERKRREIELHNNLAALDKRVRELRCLYEIAALISDPAMPLASVMQSVTELVARAYQYPAITCVRIRVGSDLYETDGFVETEWEQTSTIGTLSSHLGTLQVCYREPRPEVDEGPFSEEERDLIESIGQLLGDFLERRTTAGELRRTNALLETLFASTNYKIAFLDAEFRYIRVNEAYSRSWGQDPESYVGRSHFELFPGDEDIFRRVLRTGTPYMAADKVRSSGDESASTTFWDWELFPMSGEGVGGSGLVLILVDRTRRHRALKDLEGSREELRQLALHLQELREDERKTVAREIHDELGGLLTALKMEISILGKTDVPLSGACLESYDSAIELIDQSISMIQRLTSDLRPRILDDFGLVAAIEWHIKEFQKRAGIECALKVGSGSYIMEKNRTAAVFRILQESLTNVARHAHATRVLVSLRKLGGRLYLRVADNGIGIEDSLVSAATSYGLLGIRERAQSLGGQVSISGRKGRGTTLSLEIPLPREEAQ
ncbi:MAG TPA: PAS domain S-box protein [Spirochaetia bacterium]|nr:PAS domain S-box protein [Spirochaetia bacterium]